MTDKQFMACVSEADNYTDKDAYISDLCLSSMWGDAEDADIPAERVEALGNIWDACHRSVRDISVLSGLNQRKLADHFCIPYRTVQDWHANRRPCPIYTRLMMQECLGLLIR